MPRISTIHDSQGLVLHYPPKHINVWYFELVTQSLRYCMYDNPLQATVSRG